MSIIQIEKAETTLIDAKKILDNIVSHVTLGKNIQNYSINIWEIYCKVEYSILLLKLHLDEENPGRFIEVTKLEKNYIKILTEVSDDLSRSIKNMKLKNYFKAIEHARNVKQILHNVLLDLRKKIM